MERRYNLHVDHEIPFQKLFAEFLKSKSLDYESVELEDLGPESRFADRELAKSWQEYHLANAKLRLTHDQCNLARKAA
jgi:negative regulator of sigma E activity